MAGARAAAVVALIFSRGAKYDSPLLLLLLLLLVVYQQPHHTL